MTDQYDAHWTSLEALEERDIEMTPWKVLWLILGIFKTLLLY